MYVDQIFELSMVLDNGRFQKIFSGAYHIEEREDEYIDQSLASDGITVIYRNSQYKKKVKVIVNSSILLGSDVFDSDRLIRKLDKYIIRYFKSRYRLCDFSLSGMILATDIDVHKQSNVSAYLNVRSVLVG